MTRLSIPSARGWVHPEPMARWGPVAWGSQALETPRSVSRRDAGGGGCGFGEGLASSVGKASAWAEPDAGVLPTSHESLRAASTFQ